MPFASLVMATLRAAGASFSRFNFHVSSTSRYARVTEKGGGGVYSVCEGVRGKETGERGQGKEAFLFWDGWREGDMTRGESYDRTYNRLTL